MFGSDKFKEDVTSQPSKGRNSYELVWFSHLEKEFQVVDVGFKKLFRWKEDEPPKLWDWDNCTMSRAKILPDGKVRLVVRSKTNRNSDYMGSIPVELRYMLGVDIASISEPYTEIYELASSKRKNLPNSVKNARHKRWVCSLDQKYWVWQWANKDIDMKSSKIYSLYGDIKEFLEESQRMGTKAYTDSTINGNVFKVALDQKLDDYIPVIYQPAIDSLKNFLREVHCSKMVGPNSSDDIEVSLIFNNEELRRNRYLDGIYSRIRYLIYGRTQDVETFRMHFAKYDVMKHQDITSPTKTVTKGGKIGYDNNDENDYKNYFILENIYSGEHGIEHDTIHLDRPPAPKRPVWYYFSDHYHPIIFINTANHAMGEHDNNHDLWKWEYIPWVKKAPIKLGIKSRKNIELRYIPLITRILSWFPKI
jgi:hypothetical protein